MSSKRQAPGGEQQPSLPPPAPARLAYGVSNVSRLAGVAVVVHEVFLRAELRPLALALAALMFGGAQGLRDLLDVVLRPPK